MVQRVECAEDGRGAFVAITPEGRTAIEAAAPGHVEAVRRLVFDALRDEDATHLGTIVDQLLARLDSDEARDSDG